MKNRFHKLAKMMQVFMHENGFLPVFLRIYGENAVFVDNAMKLFCPNLAFCDLFFEKIYCTAAHLLLE
jgi:hypothetical protein